MTCEEAELELVTADAVSAEVKQHVATCESCKAFQTQSASIISAASLPAPTAEEKASLTGLAPRVLMTFKQAERRGSFVRRIAGLAMAAGLGAAVASAALLPKLNNTAQVVVTTETTPEWSLPSLSEVELASSTDTVDELEAFEVSWPSP